PRPSCGTHNVVIGIHTAEFTCCSPHAHRSPRHAASGERIAACSCSSSSFSWLSGSDSCVGASLSDEGVVVSGELVPEDPAGSEGSGDRDGSEDSEGCDGVVVGVSDPVVGLRESDCEVPASSGPWSPSEPGSSDGLRVVVEFDDGCDDCDGCDDWEGHWVSNETVTFSRASFPLSVCNVAETGTLCRSRAGQ